MPENEQPLLMCPRGRVTYNCASGPAATRFSHGNRGTEMNWFLLNVPPAAAFFGASVGIPLWLTFKHHASRPSFSALDAHLDAKTALAD